MARKLLLSVIGAFWAKKSVMCIATALVCSVVFQTMHSLFWVRRSERRQLAQTVRLLTAFSSLPTPSPALQVPGV